MATLISKSKKINTPDTEKNISNEVSPSATLHSAVAQLFKDSNPGNENKQTDGSLAIKSMQSFGKSGISPTHPASSKQLNSSPSFPAIQRKISNNNAQKTAVGNNKTGLPENLKTGVEQLSSVSLDDVKVHYNSSAPAQLHAHAYAQGTDIHVAPGQEKHLPHEAWHVVQQKQGRVQATTQLKGNVNINDNESLENEATQMGNKALNDNKKVKNPLNNHTINTPTAQLWPKWLGGKGDEEKNKEAEKTSDTTVPEQSLWSKISNGAGAAAGTLGSLGSAAIKGAGSAWNSTKKHAGSAWESTKSNASSGWDSTKEHASSGWDSTKKHAGSFWKGTKSAAVAGAGAIGSIGGKIYGGATGAFAGAKKSLSGKGDLDLDSSGNEQKDEWGDLKRKGFWNQIKKYGGEGATQGGEKGKAFATNQDNVTGNLIKSTYTNKKEEVKKSLTTSVGDHNRLGNKVSDRMDRIKGRFTGEGEKKGHRGFLSSAAGKIGGAAGAAFGSLGGGVNGMYKVLSGQKDDELTAEGTQKTHQGTNEVKKKAWYSQIMDSSKQGASAGYSVGDRLGDGLIEGAKTVSSVSLGAATGALGAIGGAGKGAYDGWKNGYGVKNGAMLGGIMGGIGGYQLGSNAAKGLIGLADELPGAAIDTARAGLGAATGTLGALGGAVKGGVKGAFGHGDRVFDGKGKRVRDEKTGKGKRLGAWEQMLRSGKSAGKAGFEMGANSKASQTVISKGVGKAAETVGDMLIPFVGGKMGKISADIGLKGYYGDKFDDDAEDKAGDAASIAEIVKENTEVDA